MIEIYNSATKKQAPFTPLDKGGREVGIYVCGPTVQSTPHIGHMRVAVAFDTIRRYLMAAGYSVTFVQNVTDIDDKILHKSKDAGVPWKEWAQIHEKQFFDAYDKLGVLRPTHTPHATEYIEAQIELVQDIIEAGNAYEGEPGDVWFDTEALKSYGELTNQEDASSLEVSEEDARPDKRSPRDFALWKAPSKHDPLDASWDSPWGRGRPGWHTECTAMSTALLGERFDIHGGGLDLRFPHHENELAQAKARGDGFANIWMHSAWVTAKGEKMSKSLGNGLCVFEVVKESLLDALSLRYALVGVHYRSMLEWTPDTLPAARTAIKRIYNHLDNVGGAKYTKDLVESVDIRVFPEFDAAMRADFSTSGALAAIHIGMKKNLPVLYLRRALSILGIDPFDPHWVSAFEDESDSFTKAEREAIEQKIEARAKAKQAKDFVLADAIRDELLAEGVVLVDTADGVTYSRNIS
ncbi:MAG: cysteine--tRNA ligase [Candidatus Ancillula sp.]|jgi:cysteinyl-tRNA synthetase|nr:cysteine--tRNA ligase [Candidatus Ancillula sp.]